MAYTQNASIPEALRALMTLNQQANPTTPSGQPTIAAQEAQKASAQMGGGNAAPAPQVQGLPALAQNAATGANIQMQQQQAAHQQMLNQAQQAQQAQQPVMAAEGGIMSLPINMEEYADGGIVGYAGPNGSEVNLGGISGVPYYYPGESEEREALNKMPMRLLEDLIDAIKAGGKKFVKGTTMDPERVPSKDAAALAENTTGVSEPPPGTKTPSAAAPVSASYDFPARSYMEEAPRQAAPRRPEGIEQALPPAAKESAEPTLMSAAKEAMGIFPRPDDARLRAEGERLRELQQQRPTSAAEMAANAVARDEQKKQYDEIAGRDTGLGELMSVLGGISRRTGPLKELAGYRSERDTAAAKETEAARLFAQQQALLEKKDYADKVGDVKASMEIEQMLLKIGEDYNKVMVPASTSAYSTTAQLREGTENRKARAQQAAADRASAERVARIQAEARVTGKNPYDIVNDNIQKQIEMWDKANPVPPEGAREAALATIKKTAYDDARRFGLAVPELPGGGATTGGASLRYNPQTGKIE